MGTEGIQDKYVNPYTDFGFDRLFEAAEIAKFNPKELGEYWESLKNFR
ncbi:Rpn family recombination-promoting nuclease/putative transposase [Phocaeicola sartorii]|nr:Rpn family recombination-promoting nuclease/putative transposase [Phocaeicola sartorii]